MQKITNVRAVSILCISICCILYFGTLTRIGLYNARDFVGHKFILLSNAFVGNIYIYIPCNFTCCRRLFMVESNLCVRLIDWTKLIGIGYVSSTRSNRTYHDALFYMYYFMLYIYMQSWWRMNSF